MNFYNVFSAERRRIHVQADGVSQFRGWILPSPYLWADYVTAPHGMSVKCGRQMCPSFARFEGCVVSILRGPSFPMIQCGSQQFGQTGAAMADHSGKSLTPGLPRQPYRRWGELAR
ncbi:hypothetical protein ATANTOWER_020342 [Ataeniobius toweri]|uniref:Uncharacterized protein n=1 Tax=Ataeniobius toweri TaxID=208326 RepID=A0ABU7AHH8_9TELE|nr:hypothetical protein [Ataeniobius toweri]